MNLPIGMAKYLKMDILTKEQSILFSPFNEHQKTLYLVWAAVDYEDV